MIKTNSNIMYNTIKRQGIILTHSNNLFFTKYLYKNFSLNNITKTIVNNTKTTKIINNINESLNNRNNYDITKSVNTSTISNIKNTATNIYKSSKFQISQNDLEIKSSLIKEQNSVNFESNSIKLGIDTSDNNSSPIKNDVLCESQLNFFNNNGYVVLENVFSESRIDKLKQEMNSLIISVDKSELSDVFKANMNFTSDYFLDSGDKIRFFLESDSFDSEGNLKYDLSKCVNKAGHGMHDINPIFKEFSYSKEIKSILRSLKFVAPTIVQSMYILKSKKIGGEVNPHTDNTYLRTKPLSCIGIWIALDDATIENGAMYGVPKSHLEPTTYFSKLYKDKDGKRQTRYNMSNPPDYDITNSKPLEAKKGSVIILHGDFVHYSSANKSDRCRHAYTLHVVERGGEYIWEEDNWLQRKDIPFKIINLNKI